MKVVVAIKCIAQLDDEFELTDDGSVDLDGFDWDLNEWDSFSLEAAMQLRDAAGDGEVVAVTVGDEEETEEGMLSALAKGADRGIRVWDDSLAGADALAVARVLAAAIASEEPDLILCGVQSSDAVNSATGIALAAHLDLPHVAVVRGLEVEGSDVITERELEGGVIEILRVGLPALLTIQTGINEPRYANLRAIKQARDKPQSVLSLADVGLDPAAVDAARGSHRRRLARPEQGAKAEMLDGSAAEIAAEIASLVEGRLS